MACSSSWAAQARALLLLAAACALVALSAAAQSALLAPSPEFDGLLTSNRTINICTSETAPIVYCLDREPAAYAGFEIALFERVRQQLGWANDRLNWKCLEWYEMLDALEAGNGTCDLAVAGIDISRANLERGLTFTYPTISAGYRVAVGVGNVNSLDIWVFMDAFQWQLWLAIVLTSVAVGVIVWGTNRWANITRRPAGAQAAPDPELQPLVWASLGRPMQLGEMGTRNFASSFIVLAFGFMMLVLTAIYTGNTAANLTASQLQSRIRSVEDLPGKSVATWADTEYLTDLQRRGIVAEGLPWDNNEDLEAMLDGLRDGRHQALVLDSYTLEFAAASQCDVEVVGGTWDEYDCAVAFQAGFADQALLKRWSEILISLKDAGDVERLAKQWINPPEAACKTSGVNDAGTKISFEEVSGLWIVLAASVGVALLLVVISQVTLHSARRVASTAAVRNTMRRLRTVGQRSGAAQDGSTGGGSGGTVWQWPGVGIASRQGSLQPEPSVQLSDKEACGGEGQHGGAALADGPLPSPGVAQVLAAVERMERLLQQQQQQQQGIPKL